MGGGEDSRGRVFSDELEAGEPHRYRRLVRAVRTGDPRRIVDEARPWLASVGTTGLTDLAARHGDDGFKAAVANLMERGYGRDGGRWDGSGFVSGLAAARRRALRTRAGGDGPLPGSLNP